MDQWPPLQQALRCVALRCKLRAMRACVFCLLAAIHRVFDHIPDAETSKFGLYLFQSIERTSKSCAGIVTVEVGAFVSHNFTVRSPDQ